MIHLLSLRYNPVSSEQSLNCWLETHPNLEPTAEQLFNQWPQLKASTLCLFDYLSPHLLVADYPAIYQCLSNAIIEVSGSKVCHHSTVNRFNDALSLTASSLLTNLTIQDADHQKGWHPIYGTYLQRWLQFNDRLTQLKEGDLTIEHYDSCESTLFRMQRLIQLRTLLSVTGNDDESNDTVSVS